MLFTMKKNGRLASGFTLVELLVAITIASVLTVVALPRVREGLQQNAAARNATLVKSVFENARGNAIRTGRPYGVILHRVKNTVTPGNEIDDPLLFAQHGVNYCNRFSFAQMAFDYRGDIENATLEVDTTSIPGTAFLRAYSSTAGLIYAVATGVIPVEQQPLNVGSVIRFGKNRTPRVITGLVAVTTATPPYTRVFVDSAFPILPGERQLVSHGEEVEFSIETRPVPSPLASIDLPGKVALDFTNSGLPQDPVLLSPYSINRSTDANRTPGLLPDGTRGYRDVIIMFNASGQLNGIYLDQHVAGTANTYAYVKRDPIGQLSLLIGETDSVVLPPTIATYETRNPNTLPTVPNGFNHTGRKRPNFANPDASWLSINPSSGKILLKSVATPFGTANEALVHPELGTTHTPDILIRDRLLDSRRLTRGSQL